VPSDRFFVVTDYTSTTAALLVNGMTDPLVPINDKLAPVLRSGTGLFRGTRFVFQPGTVLSLPIPSTGQGYSYSFWGYLEPVS